ncbi:hypothetical protein B005_1371 [Nocardiopsis alba ATCC BAA-2165]|uniref:Uncharacterized protein n=1 Tax=Nocardiopsis alba (strain ATCC BAA-2165 / BE74) TaxID=1205910 RepID=J7LIT1_NOCAA|nr:hypothetical protein B005_1371 [Nocardiopsis alba ATCC BAA-2165]
MALGGDGTRRNRFSRDQGPITYTDATRGLGTLTAIPNGPPPSPVRTLGRRLPASPRAWISAVFR